MLRRWIPVLALPLVSTEAATVTGFVHGGPWKKVAVVPSHPTVYFTEHGLLSTASGADTGETDTKTSTVGHSDAVKVDCGNGDFRVHNVIVIAENVWTLAESVCDAWQSACTNNMLDMVVHSVDSYS